MMQRQISGVRTGTVPWYLDPRHIRSKAAEEARLNRGIFLEPEDIDDFLATQDRGMPEIAPEAEERRIDVISPTGQTGTIFEGEKQDYINQGFTIVGEQIEEQTLGATEMAGLADIAETAEERAQQFKYPTLRTFATMSPLRFLLERRKAKKLLRGK